MLTLLLGPVLGLLGSSISSVFRWLERKQEIELRREERLHEVELVKLNIAARGQEMENEAWLAQMSATAEMLKSSYEHDASYGPVTQGAAVWLRWVRPGITFTLIGLVAVVFFADPAASLHDRIVSSLLTLSESAIFWWFGDRSLARSK